MVTDNGPTRLPYFNETCAAMPSRRSKDEVAALIAGAHACARAGNLHTGVYNVEMKYTSQGPRLIEINARLGGFYLTNWAQRVFGVNLIRCVLQVACGIRPIIKDVMPKPTKYCVGLQLYNSQHGKGLRPLVPKNEQLITAEERLEQNRMRMLDHEGVVIWIPMAAGLKDEPMEWEGAYANVGCSGASHEEAAAKLLSVVRCLHLDQGAELKTDYYINGLGIKVEKKPIIPVVPFNA
uniref:ATP-grasp domain-containing protein n=1 Tax=Paramoeba aestuarina TaxID=180227 RepID=A0A7S4N6U4_9EUKA|mmetsp:Transcript_1184/g.1890  ORF Transcript_1184/g.1890 Transcript_1184/m.1890 type:complete len:237 (+) Transcript_1184:1-711(+)